MVPFATNRPSQALLNLASRNLTIVTYHPHQSMERTSVLYQPSLVRVAWSTSIVSAAVALTAFASDVAVAQGPAKAAPVFADGQAQVVAAFEDPSNWIRDELWIETEFDSD